MRALSVRLRPSLEIMVLWLVVCVSRVRLERNRLRAVPIYRTAHALLDPKRGQEALANCAQLASTKDQVWDFALIVPQGPGMLRAARM